MEKLFGDEDETAGQRPAPPEGRESSSGSGRSRFGQSFTALVENTGASLPAERGKINKALSQIRDATPLLTDPELALEISHRAILYRKLWPEVSISPTALSQNWERIVRESERPSATQTNQASSPTSCKTCEGDRFVVVQTRPAPHGKHEEMAPCPDCNPAEIKFKRYDGTWFRSLDPAETRRRMVS